MMDISRTEHTKLKDAWYLRRKRSKVCDWSGR